MDGAGAITTQHKWYFVWVVALLVPAGASLCAFAVTASFENFIWDDSANYVYRLDLRSFSFPNLERWVSTTEGEGRILGRYEPVAQILKAAFASVGVVSYDQGHAKAMHTVCLLSHALAALLSGVLAAKVGCIGKPFCRTRAGGVSAIWCCLGASLFSCSPLRAQVVGWVSCAPIIWASLFAQCAFLIATSGSGLESSRHTSLYGLSLRGTTFFLYVAACLTKASALPLPACIMIVRWENALCDVQSLHRTARLRSAAQAALGVLQGSWELVFGMPMLAMITLGSFEKGSTVDVPHDDVWPRAFLGLWTQLIQSFHPAIVSSPVHPLASRGGLGKRLRTLGQVAAIQTAIVTVVACHALLRRRSPGDPAVGRRLAALWFGALAMMAPFAIPSGQPTLYADRNVYLASALLLPAVVRCVLGHLFEVQGSPFIRFARSTVIGAICIVLAYWCLVVAPATASLYASEGSLWERVLDLYPYDHSALHNLGGELRKQGRPHEAEALLRKSLCTYETPLAAYALHEVLRADGRQLEARKWVAKSLRMLYVHKHPVSSNFQVAMIHNDMGVHAALGNEMQLATDNFREALRWSEVGADARVRANLGLALALAGDSSGCSSVLASAPMHFSGIWRARVHNVLGVCNFLQGDFVAAQISATKAVTLNAGFKAYADNLELIHRAFQIGHPSGHSPELPQLEKEWLWAT